MIHNLYTHECTHACTHCRLGGEFMNKLKLKATRKDVAKLANVSETIVSYVANGNRYVDSEKKKRVKEAMKTLNYTPNPIARSLKGKNSKHMLFIVDQIDNEHFSRVVKAMDELAYEKRYLISLLGNRRDDDFLHHILSRQVDGIIISSMSMQEDSISHLINAGLPVVLVMNKDYNTEFKDACKIYTGLYNGARDIAKRLCDKGRKNILYIDRMSTKGVYSNLMDHRYRGYYDVCKEHNICDPQENFISGCKSHDEIFNKIKARLKSDKTVDGIMARNDLLATLALKAISEMGLTVPNDISVVGFDNSSIANYTSPKLSTVEIDRDELARQSIEMICAMLDGEKPDDVHINTNFINGESL